MEQSYWEKCVAFHGHVCGGLTIGYKAALYAIDLLTLKFSDDEQIICISENDACGVDAIQVVLGCSLGKGNLLFRIRGKQAFSFYERSSGRSVRLVMKDMPRMSKEKSFARYQEMKPSEMFDVKEVQVEIPEKARIFDSHICDCCGERTADKWLKLQGKQKLCLDCFIKYDRFNV